MKINCPCCCRYQTPEESDKWFQNNEDCVSAFVTNSLWKNVLEERHISQVREITYFKFLLKKYSLEDIASVLEKEKIDLPDYLKSTLEILNNGSWHMKNENEFIQAMKEEKL